MKRPEKEPSLIRGSIATPSLVAGIMNAKYVNGMPLARQEVSAKYYYVTHELRLHQNDRCKRFTLF